MKRVKVHGCKKWENGWKGRKVYKRRIEVAFRQTQAADIDEQLAAEVDPVPRTDPFVTLCRLFARVA